jgi:diacylglycerol kinase (ATP)
MPEKVLYSPVDGVSAAAKRTSERRKNSFKVANSLWVSFQYAWAGLTYAFSTQRNFRVHTIIGSIAITLGLFLRIPGFELALIGLTIGLVLTLELLNTAIEAVVDLAVDTQYHELAKIAKDCAAGAVMVSALAAVLVAALLLLPPLWELVMYGMVMG